MSLFRDEVLEHRKARLHGEIILTQPVSTRLLVGALVAIVGVAISWLALGSYSRIEHVRGILVTDQPSIKIFAPLPGVVLELLVSEGSVVHEGDKIAIINLDRKAASGRPVAEESLDALESRNRIGIQQIALSKRREDSERARLSSAINAAEDQIGSLKSQIALQTELVASNQKLFDQSATLADRGVVSKVELERKRQALIASRQIFAGIQQQLAAKSAEIEQIRAQLRGLAVDADREVSTILAEQQQLAQQKTQLEGQQAYIIAAPISGRVSALQVAIGRAANPAMPMMVVIPEGAALRVELYAPSRAVGFVHHGQEARLLFDAFPYQRFGSFGGRIDAVSRTVIDPRETDVPLKLDEPMYRVSVKLDRQTVDADGTEIALQPGMTLEGNIILERQSFLSWLLKPLKAVTSRTT